MSNFIITYDGLLSPSQACVEPPPQPSLSGEKIADSCFFNLPLADEDLPVAPSRMVRFDRNGDKFILSQQNAPEVRSWMHRHQNLPALLEVVRLAGLMTRTSESMEEFSNKLRFVISQYIITGVVRFPNSAVIRSVQEDGDSQRDLANLLLGSFTISTHEAVAKTLGTLMVARASLAPDVRERIEWVSSLLDLVPHYRDLTNRLIKEAEIAHLEELPKARQNAIRVILNYCRKLVIQKWMGVPLQFDKDVQDAYFAYQYLNPHQEMPKQVEDFCQRLGKGLQGLLGQKSGDDNFFQDCREGLLLSDLPIDVSIPESLRGGILNRGGLALLQKNIARESEAARMSIEWLEKRGRVQEVLLPILKNVGIHFLPPDRRLSLTISISQLDLNLTLMIDAHPANRREYLLASLAILRQLFGSAAEFPPVRVFYQGAYRQITWKIDAENRERLRSIVRSIEKRLELSHRRSDVGLPVMEGVVCAMGVIGLGLSEGISGIKNKTDLHLGIGTSSAGLLGAGCSALAAHFILPKIAKVRNRYVWEAITALGGALLGSGMNLLINLKSSNPENLKYPVDPYGP